MRVRFSLMLALVLIVAGALPAAAANHMYKLSDALPARAEVVVQSADGLVARVAVPELQWGEETAQGAAWDIVAANGWGTTSTVGAPMLPVLVRLVRVGPREGVVATVTNAETETIGGVNLWPFQPPVDRNATALPPFAIDADLYETDAWWPAEPVAVQDPVIIHGARYVPVEFYPVQYNPARGVMRVIRAADLVVAGGVENSANALARPLPESATFGPMLADLAWTLGRDAKAANDNWTAQDGAILIVVADQFLAGIQPYIEWKQLKGLPVEIVKTSELPGGGQTPAVTKELVNQRYHDTTLPPLDYVLLVGDQEHIATMHGLYGCAADSMFVTVDGDDYFPDAVIGRWPVKTAAELANVVNKSVNYERDPQMAQTDWFTKGIATSGSDSVDDQNATFVGEVLLGDGDFASVDYLFTSKHNFSAANLTAAFNQGRSWMAYFGHGTATTWASSSPSFTIQNVMALQQNGKLPVITDIACDNAHFDQSADCFAEVWIKHAENSGTAGIFAASRNTPFGWTDQLGRGVAVGHFSYGYLTFGTAAYFGKMYMYHVYPEGSQGTTEEVFQHYLIFGDPELNVWSDVPEEMDVDAPDSVEVGEGALALDVAVLNAPLEMALVHAWRDDADVDFVGRTDATGAIELPADLFADAGSVNLFVTGRNALPYEGEIDVVEPAAGDDDDATPGDDDDTAGGDDDDASKSDGDDDDDNDSGGCGG